MVNNDGFDINYDSLTEVDWFSSLNPAFDIDKYSYHTLVEIYKKSSYNVCCEVILCCMKFS